MKPQFIVNRTNLLITMAFSTESYLKVYLGASGTVREALQQLDRGQLIGCFQVCDRYAIRLWR